MDSSAPQNKRKVWFLLWFPPVLFLLVIIAFTIYFGARAQGDANAIAEKTAAATPYILLTVQMLLLVLQFSVFRRQGVSMHELGWQVSGEQKLWKELLLGVAIGAPLGVLWIYVIEPLLSNIQATVGDYVPAGSLFPALGAAIIPFAIANLLLAPFAEENIYRGYAIAKLMPRLGATSTVILSSLFFGLLHWSGGFWYMLITGIIVGVPFAILRINRGNILAAYGAHLALNLVETLMLYLLR